MDINQGLKRKVFKWLTYFINWYKFHTKQWSQHKLTSNFSVCIKGTNGEHSKNDKYGKHQEVIQLNYGGLSTYMLVLFDC